MTIRERRRYPRYRFQGTAVITVGGDGPEQVSVVSLSIDGCRFLGANLPMRGARCRLVLQNKGKEFAAECEVTWRGEGVVGVKFIGVDNPNMESLRQVCKHLPLEPLQPPSLPDSPLPE